MTKQSSLHHSKSEQKYPDFEPYIPFENTGTENVPFWNVSKSGRSGFRIPTVTVTINFDGTCKNCNLLIKLENNHIKARRTNK